MRDVIKFGKTVTFEDLNPHNFHLKNDYINNILFAALSTFPALNAEGVDAKVLRGFVSSAYMENNMPEMRKHDYSGRYTQGLGLQITWDEYEPIVAISLITKLVQSIKSNVLALINQEAEYVELFFEMPDEVGTCVYEITDAEKRQIL